MTTQSIGLSANSSQNSLISSQSGASTASLIQTTNIQMREASCISTSVPQSSGAYSTSTFKTSSLYANSSPMDNTSNLSSISSSSGAKAHSSNSTLSASSTVVAGNSEPVSLDSLSSMSSSLGAIANTSGTERTRDLALCAVLLDEWLKELAAISKEQSIIMLGENL